MPTYKVLLCIDVILKVNFTNELFYNNTRYYSNYSFMIAKFDFAYIVFELRFVHSDLECSATMLRPTHARV